MFSGFFGVVLAGLPSHGQPQLYVPVEKRINSVSSVDKIMLLAGTVSPADQVEHPDQLVTTEPVSVMLCGHHHGGGEEDEGEERGEHGCQQCSAGQGRCKPSYIRGLVNMWAGGSKQWRPPPYSAVCTR